MDKGGGEEGEGERNCFYYLHGITYTFSPLLFTSLLFTAICKASPDRHFAFLHFFPMGMVLIHVSCTMSRTSVHSSSGILSRRQWHPTPVLLPGKSHGWRSLIGCSPWGR